MVIMLRHTVNVFLITLVAAMHPITKSKTKSNVPIGTISYDELIKQTPSAIECAKQAFCSRTSFGALQINDIPNWKQCREKIMKEGTKLAFNINMQKNCQADDRVSPGWMGTPGQESHSLQSGFYANMNQRKIRENKGDTPVWGPNRWPTPKNNDTEVSFEATFTSAANLMNEVALLTLDLANRAAVEMLHLTVEGAIDHLIPDLRQMAEKSNFLPARLVYYDATYEREDKIMTDDVQLSYWLPWHVDFNLVTAFAPAIWINETAALNGELDKPHRNSENPECSAGLLLRNFEGNIVPAAIREDSILIQLGALSQLTTAGLLKAGAHAVGKDNTRGAFGRLSFGLFIYGPWEAQMKPSKELLTVLGDEENVLKYDFGKLMEKAYTGDTVLEGYRKFENYMNNYQL